MFAAWYLPRFMLQALRIRPRERAAVLEEVPGSTASLRENAMFLCITEGVEKMGVQSGMTVSQALARCPNLQVRYRDEKAELSVQTILLEIAESWTPDYESTQPGLCVLDLSRVRWQAHEVHSWQDRGLQMRQDILDQGYDPCIGFAENADLAILAAHVAEPVRVLRAGVAEEKRVLHELPVSVLNPSPQIHEVLQLWGIRTLGQFVALPRPDVASRLGAEGLHLRDLAQGGKERLLRLVRPQEQFREAVELESAIESLDPLMRLLERLLQRLNAQLAASWRVTGSMHLTLGFADHTRHERELRVAEPTRELPVLMRLLETYLEGLTAAAPIIFVALTLTPMRAASSQPTLFDRGLRDPNRFAETLSSLEAVLGRGRVGRAELLPTRRPDAFRVMGFLESSSCEATTLASVSRPFQGLPLQRFRPPRPVQVTLQQHRPVELRLDGTAHPLRQCQGPWLLSGGWWDTGQMWQHEIWEAEGMDGTLYRLIFEKDRWNLEGLYG